MSRALSLLAVAGALTSGCRGAPADRGDDALLRIPGAQFYEGALPPPSGGPKVESALVTQNDVVIGSLDNPLTGSVAASGTSALVGMRGDLGYYVLSLGLPDANSPEFPTFSATLEYSPELPEGPFTLGVEGVDADGRLSAPVEIALRAIPVPPPTGRLVVSLSWDDDADLDLHVVVPGGAEIFARDINSVSPPKPGKPVDPHAWESGGILDFDSNADCVIDGLRRENVIYAASPPTGRYAVRVDTFSLCGQTAARWNVTARVEGRVVGQASGESVPYDATLSHDRGGGVLALEFDVP